MKPKPSGWSEDGRNVNPNEPQAWSASLQVYDGPGSGEADLQLHHHYNGSGRRHFGGAVKWPVLTLDLPFRPDDYENANAFALKLAKFIKENYPRP